MCARALIFRFGSSADILPTGRGGTSRYSRVSDILALNLALTHDVLHPGEPLYLREALANHGVEADHVKIWQTVGKLRRRHGLVMTGQPREPGYRVVDWLWEAKKVRSRVKGG